MSKGTMPARNKKNFRPTKSGAGMTRAGVAAYRRLNPGSKLKADKKRKYPKCVPAAKAARMTDSQKRSAAVRKRSKPQGVGGKPTNVKTIVKRKSMSMGGLV